MAIVLDIKGGTPESIEIAVRPVLLGRANSCDVVINSEFASGQHCIFFITEGHVTVKDLKSTNGTMLNGELIKNSKIFIGDVVSVGRVEVALSLDAMSEEEVSMHTKNDLYETSAIDIVDKTQVPVTSCDDKNEKTSTDNTVYVGTNSQLEISPKIESKQEDPSKQTETNFSEKIVKNVDFLQDYQQNPREKGRVHKAVRDSGLELTRGINARKRERRKNRIKKLQETISVAGVQKIIKLIKKKIK